MNFERAGCGCGLPLVVLKCNMRDEEDKGGRKLID